MRQRGFYFAGTAILLLSLVVGLGGGILLDRQVLYRLAPLPGIPDSAEPQFRLIGEAWETIQREYVDREAIEPQRMAYGAISGMVATLGDTGHTRFLTPEMARREHDFTEGEFEGIGAYVEMRDNHAVIVSPFDNSPAQRAGLRPGDIIVRVDGEDTTGLALDEIVSRIQGPAGTEVTLTVMDPRTEERRTVTLKRAKIALDNAVYVRLPGTNVAHLRVAAFSKGVAQDLEGTLNEIQDQAIDALILDLRNNPGGLLSEAVAVASQFLDSGNVLLVRDAQGDITPVPVETERQTSHLPMVVLINGGTASGAEIVTGALQDAKRATIVGETTFGTGTVLHEFRLSDGSVLLLAGEEWLTPDGRVIWHKGLQPDVQVSLPPDIAPLFPLGEQDMTPEQLRASQDTQLLRALDLLTNGQNPEAAAR